MGTLIEIEAAVEALPPEEKQELFRFLAARLPQVEPRACRARLVEGPRGTLLLEVPPGAAPTRKHPLGCYSGWAIGGLSYGQRPSGDAQ